MNSKLQKGLLTSLIPLFLSFSTFGQKIPKHNADRAFHKWDYTLGYNPTRINKSNLEILDEEGVFFSTQLRVGTGSPIVIVPEFSAGIATENTYIDPHKVENINGITNPDLTFWSAGLDFKYEIFSLDKDDTLSISFGAEKPNFSKKSFTGLKAHDRPFIYKTGITFTKEIYEGKSPLLLRFSSDFEYMTGAGTLLNTGIYFGSGKTKDNKFVAGMTSSLTYNDQFLNEASGWNFSLGGKLEYSLTDLIEKINPKVSSEDFAFGISANVTNSNYSANTTNTSLDNSNITGNVNFYITYTLNNDTRK